MSRRRARKQRVVLRAKRRVALRHRFKGVFVGGIFTVLAAILGIELFAHRTGWAARYIQNHTPVVKFQAPELLSELPLLKEPPPARFGLWLPGAETRLRSRWLRDYPAVSKIRFEKRFFENRILAHLEPRVPLVRWEDRGLDKEGTVFSLPAERWAGLPKASFSASESLPALGRWLEELSRVTALWNRVVGVSKNARGEMWLDMDTGTRVAWGAPDVQAVREKARCLTTVLDDAHSRLSGAATADMRFFDEGRVIVKPKTTT